MREKEENKGERDSGVIWPLIIDAAALCGWRISWAAPRARSRWRKWSRMWDGSQNVAELASDVPGCVLMTETWGAPLGRRLLQRAWVSCCGRDGHPRSYGHAAVPGLDFIISNLRPPRSPVLPLPPSLSPSVASLPFSYQIAATRSQLSPVGGSFLGWISVKWTHGIGRQSVTLSRDEREWERWAPRRRCRVEGQKFMLQMHLRSMIISADVRPHDT